MGYRESEGSMAGGLIDIVAPPEANQGGRVKPRDHEVTHHHRVRERPDRQRRDDLVQNLHKQQRCDRFRLTANQQQDRDQPDRQVDGKQNGAGWCPLAIRRCGPRSIRQQAGAHWQEYGHVDEERKDHHQPHDAHSKAASTPTPVELAIASPFYDSPHHSEATDKR